MMRIISAQPLPGFRVQVAFNNGESGVVDLSPLAGRGVFQAWEHEGAFEAAFVTSQGALAWPGEIDLCPDALYLRMTGKSAGELFPRLSDSRMHA